MNIKYPVSDILDCVEDINLPKKKIDNNTYKTFTLNNTTNMKKKIKETQGTFGETFEIEETVEDTFDDAEPFEIDEIKKVDNLEIKKKDIIEDTFDNIKPFEIDEIKKKDTIKDILVLTDEITNQHSLQGINTKDLDTKEISKLKEQISELKEQNVMLGNDINQISKSISQGVGDKEFQVKLELIYKQQNIIKDYENQISKLKEQKQLLEQKFELPPKWLTGDIKYNETSKNDLDKVSQVLSQEEYNEELKTKSEIIYEQQNIVKDYQDQISKLKEKNQLLLHNIETINNSNQISDQTIHQEKNKAEIEDMVRKIKYYQDDNLRLSNEVVKLSNKLENTKRQLEHFENNKAKLVSQLENLNNIISENNVVNSPFDINSSTKEDVPETEKKISKELQTPQHQPPKIISPKQIINSDEINRTVKDIFKK